MQEVRSVRSLLEDQLAALSWDDAQRRDPIRARLLRDLVASGFSPQLARSLVEKMPRLSEATDSARWVRAVLDRNLPVAADENAIVDRGGVYALVGPTGVGKTTTTAKLAARCVVRHGAQKMALLTTDGYRIGAHEQLRIYGRILGVAVHAVKDAADLKLALAELAGKHMVLIDTVGMSQRDRMVTEQVAMLAGAGNVQRLLLLNAAAAGETLDEVVAAYRGDGLAGCIVTKVDEAAGLGTVLDAVIRHRLPVHYVANGQRVPEDLHPANRHYLVHRALRPPRQDSPRAFSEGDLSLMMAGAAPLAMEGGPIGQA
jgi:flagellar biosynthesis protein FlhF